MRFRLETERLILRDLTPGDDQAAFLWCGDPDVARYMVYPVYTNAGDVRAWLESRDLDDPDEFDAGIVLKSTGELIGSAGMYYKPEEDLWTIGYNLRKDQWGHGYAVEAIRGVLEYVKTQRDVRGIQGQFASENHKSRRVMEKLGMTCVGETTYSKLDGSETFPAKQYRRLFR
jgi:ribosomal-protein-alanine N-acetyltransferase